jgi:tellurite resistance-related uncharacterized protein
MQIITDKTQYNMCESRSYSGIIGLLVNNIPAWSKASVSRCVDDWYKQKINKSEVSLNVIVGEVETLIYDYNERVIHAPIIRIYSEIPSKYDHMSDDELVNVVYSLFEYIKINLKQNIVRFTYNGHNKVNRTYRIETLVPIVNTSVISSTIIAYDLN